MPYILAKKRDNFDGEIDMLVNRLLEDPDNIEGNLNYIISTMISCYLDGKLNYKNINAMVGALECCKLELYSRVAVNYEKKKCSDNGDVYGNFNKE
jgi:hypothetical protein